jgi:hypothetical protein
MRRNSFLSSEKRSNPSWISDFPFATSSLHRLLDVAFASPPCLEQLSSLQSRPYSDRSQTPHVHKYSSLLTRFLLIYDQLKIWYNDFSDRKEGPSIHVPMPTTWDNSFLDPEERIQSKIFPLSYSFADFTDAMALVYFDAIRIKIFVFINEIVQELRRGEIKIALPGSTLERARDLLRSAEAFESASRICQSIPFFFNNGKVLVGPLLVMFPFHVAFGVFCQSLQNANRQEESSSRGQPVAVPGPTNFRRELKWCQMVSEKYEEAQLPSSASLELGRSVNKLLELRQLSS